MGRSPWGPRQSTRSETTRALSLVPASSSPEVSWRWRISAFFMQPDRLTRLSAKSRLCHLYIGSPPPDRHRGCSSAGGLGWLEDQVEGACLLRAPLGADDAGDGSAQPAGDQHR